MHIKFFAFPIVSKFNVEWSAQEFDKREPCLRAPENSTRQRGTCATERVTRVDLLQEVDLRADLRLLGDFLLLDHRGKHATVARDIAKRGQNSTRSCQGDPDAGR